MLFSIINNPTAGFKPFLPLFFSPVPGIPCGSLTFHTRYLLDALLYRSVPAVYSFSHPVSSGNIPGIPDVSVSHWAIPAPSGSLKSKRLPVISDFPATGTHPSLFPLMRSSLVLYQRISPAYWHSGISLCSRFRRGFPPLSRYQCRA